MAFCSNSIYTSSRDEKSFKKEGNTLKEEKNISNTSEAQLSTEKIKATLKAEKALPEADETIFIDEIAVKKAAYEKLLEDEKLKTQKVTLYNLKNER